MKYNKLFLVLVILMYGLQLNAQIGYQVSLLNSATGEPRANETVSVEVEISNSEGAVICSETKSATTNEFGVLSLQIGNASTFENVDWSKLPLYVSATVDDIMVGKSQILNVPVAEAAKKLVSVSPDIICKTWEDIKTDDGFSHGVRITLSQNNTFSYSFGQTGGSFDQNGGDGFSWVSMGSGTFLQQGNLILLCLTSGIGYYLPTCLVYNNGKLYGGFGLYSYELQ